VNLDCEVVIVGGGPAGLGLAIALSRLGRKVVVLERTRYDRQRAGETFGGELGPVLVALGAWDDFHALGPVPFRGVQSAWGGPELAERASLFNPFGDGWHVDRARFDACLAECAARAGAIVQQGTGACALERGGPGWRVRPAAGPEVAARYLVLASGRGAPTGATSAPERHWLRADRLVALLGRLSAPTAAIEPALQLEAEPALLLEAVEEGWWYSVPQPDGSLLATLMTDGDLLPARGRAALAEHFTAALARTAHTAARAAGGMLTAEPWIARADSGLLLPDRGPDWRALGDAAMACDPLAGNGVVRSLNSALQAAPDIDRTLSGAPSSTPDLHAGFIDYLAMRGRYYAREPRWPEAPFWARRRPVAWQAAPLFLEPQQPLVRTGVAAAREALAPIESLIPPEAIRAVLDRLRQQRPAHEALAFLKSVAPLEDLRLLVALQYLVHCKLLSAV
jgi:flavin-dependent dehydrogenase